MQMKVISINNKATLNQVDAVLGNLSEVNYELITSASTDNLLSSNEPETLVNDTLNVLIKGQADVAILNAELLPYPLTASLDVIALCNQIQTGTSLINNSPDELLAIIAASERTDLKEIFSNLDIRKSYGKVTLVGFGPGSPDLLTIGGEHAISKADVIFYDDLLDHEYLKKYNAELINVGKRKGKHSAEQAIINRLLLNEAQKGRNVVRLKGGDPMIFAHGGEEVEFLKSNFIEVDVIPGITTALALASLTNVPLTHRGISSSVSFVSGHAAQIKLPDTDTVVCYMAGYNIPQIAAKAMADGRDPETPVMLVSNVSRPEQQEFFYTLQSLSIESKAFPTPIISIIGEVVGLRHKSEKELVKPLYLYTGSEYSGEKRYGRIVNQPLIKLDELADKTEIVTEINRLADYKWIIFTSRYAVKYFFEALRQEGKDTRSLCRIKIASIGITTTKALNEKGIFPDLQPQGNATAGIVECFQKLKSDKGKILIPQSDVALNNIPNGLKALGWEIKSVVTYKNTMPENIKPLDLTQFTGVIFASPSSVDNFIKLYGELPDGKELIPMGRVTWEKLKKYKITETFISH